MVDKVIHDCKVAFQLTTELPTVDTLFWHLLEDFWFQSPLDPLLGSLHSHSPP